MSKSPLVIMVAGDKGGVGKTTVTRTLMEYMSVQGTKYRAFDTEYPKGILKRFNPDATEIVDLETVPGQMKVFDTVTQQSVTIIDMRAGTTVDTLRTLANVGMFHMVKAGQLQMVVLHVLGPNFSSLSEIGETANIIEGSKHFLVRNHIKDDKFFDWNPEMVKVFENSRSGILDIPALNSMAVEHVETSGRTFTEFMNGEQNSFMLKGYVRHWLDQIYRQYNKIGISNLIT